MTSADRRALLEARLRERGIDAPASLRIRSRGTPPDGRIPLSPGQRRLWFLDRLHPGTAVHNVVAVLVLRGEVEPDRISEALACVVDRHDVLRTRFADDGQSAVVESPGRYELDFETVTSSDPATDAARVASTPLDLDTGPAWLARLLSGRGRDEWRLVLVFHHALMDAWSLRLFLSDLGRAYDHGGLGPPPAITYSDFAAWQLERRGSAEEAEQIEWWRERLAGAPPLDMPTDRPRPPARTGAGGVVSFSVPAEIREGLERLAKETSSTLATVGTAAFATLLTRWTSQDTVVVGMPVSGRDRPETEDVVGFFVNTAALRLDLGDNPTVTEAVGTVRRATIDALTHAGISFDRLVEELAPERDLSTPPIAQALFTYQAGGPPRSPGFSGLEAELESAPTGTAKLDLAMVLAEAETGLDGAVEFDADLFDAETVRRLVEHFSRLLAAFARDSGVRIGAIGLMEPGEAERIDRWSDGGAALATEGETAASLFASTVADRGWRAAIIHGSRVVSYAELDRMVEELAARAAAQGAGRGDIVGVSWRRSPEAVAALLAAHRIGAAFLPLDPDYPAERLSFMVEDAAPAAILTGPDVSWSWSAPDRDPGAARALTDHAAYVIYTSGSTGRPKGAVLGHRGLVAMARAVVERLGIGPDDRVLQFAAHSFDAAVYEVFTAIAAGATLVVADTTELLPGEPLAALLAEQRVSAATLPPSALSALPSSAATRLTELQTLVVAGEACPASLVRTWAVGRRFWNAYGPTEATVCTTLAEADPDDPRPPALGHPLAGVTSAVLDALGAPCPIGVVGELWVGGVTVGRGYLHRPELTDQCFVGGMYRTGDLARWRPDSQLEFRGRRDEQVKVRGFRIELGEVAAALEADSEVLHAVADVVDDSLVAWVVGSEGMETQALRSRLAVRLPAHLVPSRITAVARFPELPNGKVDRAALRRLRASEDQPIESEPGPAAVFADTFSEVLNIGPVRADDNFFDLGGHSLMATRLVTRLSERIGAEVHLRDLFRHPTPAGLAAALGTRGSESGDTPPALAGAPREVQDGDVWPLSPAQRRLWFLHQLDPHSTAYVVPLGARLRGDIDSERLNGALVSVLNRHPALRTTIRDFDGEPRSVVNAVPAHPLEVEHRWGAKAEALVAELAAIPFDMAVGPLFRARLFLTGPNEAVLAICVHHIVCDGWSAALVADDLAAAWAGTPLGAAPSFGDVAASQATADAAGELAAEVDWWTDQLNGLEAAELPVDRPRPPVPTGQGSSHSFAVSADVADRLGGLARDRHTTVFAVLVAAWGAFMRRAGRADDVVVGTPVAGRDDAAAERVVGLFVNTVALRLDTSGGPGFTELVDRAARAVSDALIHAAVPFDRVIDALGLDRDLSRTPLVQTMLAFHQQPTPEFRLDGLDVQEVALPPTTAKFDLVVDLAPLPDGGLQGLASFATDVLAPETVAAWMRAFTDLLGTAVGDPTVPLPELARHAPDARKALAGLNAGRRRPFPDDRSLVSRFLEVANRFVDAIAVRDDAGDLSYGELRARAASVSAHLISEGTRPGDVVGVRVARGSELAIAALGVLGTGAAYLPIDPGHPEVRVRAVLAQCGVRTVLDGGSLDFASAEWSDALEPGRRQGAEVPAYVMATSGSTGQPKSIAVPHRAVMRLVVDTDYVRLTPQSVVASAANPAFDASTFELWGPLLNGGRVETLPDDVVLQPTSLASALRDRGITHLFLTTALFNATVDADPQAFSSLDTLLFGGEAVDPRRVAAVVHSEPPRRLLHVYGPTECTTFATWHQVAAVEPGALTVPIGRPIANTSAWVMDADGCPVPEGWVGELWLGGPGLARGYVGEPDLTAEKFVDHDGETAYRTGDLVRLLPGADGRTPLLAFVGRIDAQVKVRGFRIELTEIEAALRGHPAVAEVAVTAQDDPERGRRLVAHLVPQGVEAPPGSAEVRAFLADRLPDHMVPALVVALDRLPLTLGGKVDRRALVEAHPAPTPRLPRSSGQAMSSTEAVLAEIWCDLLGVGDVDLDDNFFDLGGDSILAIRIVAEANAAGLGLTPHLAFRHQTVRTLAAAAGRAAVAAEQGEVAGECGLTPVQLWWLESTPSHFDHFIQGQALRLPPDVDRVALAAALADVAGQHDALRLRFSKRGEEWTAHHEPRTSDCFPLLDEVPEDGLGAKLDITKGPTAVAAVECLSRADGQPDSESRPPRLLVAIHHLCVDAVSWSVLVDDLRAAYESRIATDAAPALPRKTTSVRDWASHLRDPSAVDAAEVHWWSKAIPEGVPALPRDGAAGSPTWGDLELVEVPLTETSAVALGRGVGHATAAESVLAAVAAGLCAWTGESGVLLNVERHGRPFDRADIDLSRTVGWLTALHPLWLEPGLADVAGRLADVPADGLGFGVGRWLHRHDELMRLPVPEISWNHLGTLGSGRSRTSSEPFEADGPYPGPLAHPAMRRAHQLDVTSWVDEGRAAVAIAHSTGTHSAESVTSLALEIARAATELVTGRDAFAMSGLDDEDLQSLLDRLNAT